MGLDGAALAQEQKQKFGTCLIGFCLYVVTTALHLIQVSSTAPKHSMKDSKQVRAPLSFPKEFSYFYPMG